MRFRSFEIQNFKGISKVKIDLLPAGAGIFTLIGLNESGKTTILEAISTFKLGGSEEQSLYQTEPTEIDPSSFVPKHQKATFTGDITVKALVEFEGGERQSCIRHAEKSGNCKIEDSTIPNIFSITRGFRFENGDLKSKINTWDIHPKVKKKGKRKFDRIGNDDIVWKSFIAMASVYAPDVVYFPTFLFNIPEKITLNPKENEARSNKLYRKIIANVGTTLTPSINIKQALVDRIIDPETSGESFLGLFSLSNNRQQQIESAVNQISHKLSTTVLDSWSKIFGGSRSEREIRLKLGVDQHTDSTPRVYLQFTVRDGVQTYDIDERSTGFRWFFSFLLFTLFRSNLISTKNTLFLLDEPASNLHAGAQSQLLDSFPAIANSGNQIIYSTHSHYLINPDWLDQAYIVSNSAMVYNDLTDESTSGTRYTQVSTERYRSFVGNNPDKQTYFQPVLDRLQVVPSRLDSMTPSVLVEGKGDYLVLSLGLKSTSKAGDYAIIPTRGADHFDELVGILLGWGVNFCLCCDDDTPGRRAVRDFVDNWGMTSDKVFTLFSINESMQGKKIEDFFETSDLDMIREFFGIDTKPTKGQIQLFCSEKLARAEKVAFSEEFLERITCFDAKVRAALNIA